MMQTPSEVGNISGQTNQLKEPSDVTSTVDFSKGVEGSSKMETPSTEGVKRKCNASTAEPDLKRAKLFRAYELFKKKVVPMAEEIFKDQITDESISAMKNTLQNDYKTFKNGFIKWKIVSLVGLDGKNWSPEIKEKVEELLLMLSEKSLEFEVGKPLPDFFDKMFKDSRNGSQEDSTEETLVQDSSRSGPVEISTRNEGESFRPISNGGALEDVPNEVVTLEDNTVGETPVEIMDSEPNNINTDKTFDFSDLTVPDKTALDSLKELNKTITLKTDHPSPEMKLKIVQKELYFSWDLDGEEVETFEIYGYSSHWSKIHTCPGSLRTFKFAPCESQFFAIRGCFGNELFTDFSPPIRIDPKMAEKVQGTSVE